MRGRQIDTGFLVFWVKLYFLLKTVTGGLVTKPDSIEKLSGSGVKIEDYTSKESTSDQLRHTWEIYPASDSSRVEVSYVRKCRPSRDAWGFFFFWKKAYDLFHDFFHSKNRHSRQLPAIW
ncbi:expressed protein [Phakopsora pachyrhizi]|uniref:Expressed protein n=1 Tax=Phakopsora pachyrhizi TaxID=170000 RepID=A0AAV0B2S7_PHAPC|nr:expressed protein [Phakopsora pachyrhizi]